MLIEQLLGYVAQEEYQYGNIWFQTKSRVWFEKFSSILAKAGFKRCAIDHSVLIRQNSDSVILAVYVDDIVVAMIW